MVHDRLAGFSRYQGSPLAPCPGTWQTTRSLTLPFALLGRHGCSNHKRSPLPSYPHCIWTKSLSSGHKHPKIMPNGTVHEFPEAKHAAARALEGEPGARESHALPSAYRNCLHRRPQPCAPPRQIHN